MQHNGVAIPEIFPPRSTADPHAPPEVHPYPPPEKPNLNDEVYRQFVGRELEKIAAITLAFTAIARWVPGPIGVASRLFAVAAIGTAGETKKGSIGGAKTNPLPAPLGFADPKVYGLKPNFWLPEGSTQVVPQLVDRIGLGLKQQRYDDMRATEKEKYDQMRKLKAGFAALNHEQWLIGNWTRPREFAIITTEDIIGGKQNREVRNIAVENERLYRAHPRLRHAVSNLDWIPMDVITSEQMAALIAWDEAVLNGSLQPERIEPVNAKAIENAEQAEGIRRELVTERADP